MKNEKEPKNRAGSEHKEENYMALGMCFGMCAGSVGMSILAAFGQIAWGRGFDWIRFNARYDYWNVH